MTVKFRSDATDTRPGFKAVYTQTPISVPTVENCTSGFELLDGKCVSWLGVRANYTHAQTKCANLNATVLMLKNETFTNAIMSWDKVTKKTFRNFWVGLDNEDADEDEEKNFKWADGTELGKDDWINWKTSPRNGEGHKDKCVGSGADHPEWRRYKCKGKKVYVICQKDL